MTTTTNKTLNLWQRFRASVRKSKSTADDNIERSEPETLLASGWGFLIGIMLTWFFMMFAYAFMTDQVSDWIGVFIWNFYPNDLTEGIAVFTAVTIALTNLVVITAMELNRQASHDDIVDVIGDMGEQIDERFAEVENRISEEINRVEGKVDDITTERNI